jgi:hypothetical protein
MRKSLHALFGFLGRHYCPPDRILRIKKPYGFNNTKAIWFVLISREFAANSSSPDASILFTPHACNLKMKRNDFSTHYHAERLSKLLSFSPPNWSTRTDMDGLPASSGTN